MNSQLGSSLTRDWYFAVVSGCGLNPQTFQLMQGSTAVGSTSESLWSFFDAIPPESLNHYYEPGSSNLFSQQYGAILLGLQPLPVVQAANKLWEAAGGPASVKAYNCTIDNLKIVLASAPSVSFTMTHGGDAAQTTAVMGGSEAWDAGAPPRVAWTAKVEPPPLPPPGRARTSSMMLQALAPAADAYVSISAAFTHLTVLAAGPLSSRSSDPFLSRFSPWYLSAALTTAYRNDTTAVWTEVPPTWADFFGPDGALLRICSSIVAIDGIDVVIRSDDDSVVDRLVAMKFCPGFDVRKADEETVRIYAPPGNPFILGVNVTPIAQALG